MADVLLSLKHAVVHPGQTVGDKCDPSSLTSSAHHYHHHHHHPQVLLSPNGYTATTAGYGTTAAALCEQPFPQQPGPMFPSMSVNVSMNMTMHGYHPSGSYPTAEIQCPQVRRSVGLFLLFS